MNNSVIEMAVITIIALAPIVCLVVFRRRLGILKAGAWLVSWGAAVIAGEHG